MNAEDGSVSAEGRGSEGTGGEETGNEESPGSASGATSTEERVQEALCEVIDPCSAATGSRLNVVEMGLVKAVDVESGDGEGDHVTVDMMLTSPMCHMVPYFYQEIEERVGDLPGVESATLETDGGLEWTEEMLTEEAKRKRQAVLDDQAERYRREVGLASE